MNNTYNPALDLIRSVAILFVMSQHFMLNSHFWNASFDGLSMYLQGFFLIIFQVAVPLFLFLTGYLNCNKSLDNKYFLGGKKVLYSILFFVITWCFFRIFVLNEKFTFYNLVTSILTLKIIRYSWYIDMWIGLFLITPFLNILYHALDIRQKQMLISVVTLITIIPGMINRNSFSCIPNYWTIAYPIVYYFTGAYVREYDLNIPKKISATIVLCIPTLCCVLNIFISGGGKFVSFTGGNDSLLMFFTSLLFFLLLKDVKIRSIYLKSFLRVVSKRSLDMYLCCGIFDLLLYPNFLCHCYDNQNQFGLFYFVIIPMEFILTFLVATIKEHLLKRLH